MTAREVWTSEAPTEWAFGTFYWLCDAQGGEIPCVFYNYPGLISTGIIGSEQEQLWWHAVMGGARRSVEPIPSPESLHALRSQLRRAQEVVEKARAVVDSCPTPIKGMAVPFYMVPGELVAVLLEKLKELDQHA